MTSMYLEIEDCLKERSNPIIVEKMKRFGINAPAAFGVATPYLRQLAKQYQRRHNLAIELWSSDYHEMKMLATLIADPKQITISEMDSMTSEFYSWDICDGACFNLFRYTPHAEDRIFLYVKNDSEFVRRTSFSLIAGLVHSNKKANDDYFRRFFPLIEDYAFDNRNFVKKSVNWSLRQIGKRNKTLYEEALLLSEKLSKSDDATARWIGKDALREFNNPKIIERIMR